MPDHEITAAHLRSLYRRPYTLEEILEHAESNAGRSTDIRGYRLDRLTDEVIAALSERGFKLHESGGEVTISWEE